MSLRFRFDPQKAIEILLYIATKVPNVYHALKVLYFADKEHLARYGRATCGDSYVAMRLGPVPSGAYDLIKCTRGEGAYCRDPDTRSRVDSAFTVEGNRRIVPHRASDLDRLSETDIECIDQAIDQYGRLPMDVLKDVSHAEAVFKAADENDRIPLEALISSLPDGELLLQYLRDA